MLADPEALQTVLMAPDGIFDRPPLYDRLFGRQITEKSLVLARQEDLDRQRRALSAFWHPRRMPGSVKVMHQTTEGLVARWMDEARSGPIDVTAGMLGLTLTNISRFLFGFGPGDKACMDAVGSAAVEIDGAGRAGDIGRTAEGLRRLIDILAATSPAVAKEDDNPFAALAAPSRDSPLSRHELFDNALVFMTGGYETSAITLAWALWLLARDVDAQRAVCAEVQAAPHGEDLAVDHFRRLPQLTAVIEETMRLFPPLPAIMRQSASQVTLTGTVLEAGDLVIPCFYALHRHRLLWDKPDCFRARRFLDGDGAGLRQRFAFLPFSAGPRACVGSAIGQAQMIIALAGILRHFRLEPAHDRAIAPRVQITLRPEEAISLRLTPRD